MPVTSFGFMSERKPVVVFAYGGYAIYTFNLKLWQRSPMGAGGTTYGVAYDPSRDLYAVSCQGAAPGSVIETTGQGIFSSYGARGNGAWRKVGLRNRNVTALIRYSNDNWFVCDTTYLSKIPVISGGGAVSTIAGIVLTDALYHPGTGRYIIAGGSTARYTTDFSTFTSVAVGFGSSPATSVLATRSDGRVVVGGASITTGRVSTSDDGGTSWTNRTITGATTIRSVVHLDTFSLFCAADQGGELFTSPDGITWTSRTQLPSAVYTIGYSNRYKVAYAVDQLLNIYTSQDCITWTDASARTDGWVLVGGITTRGATVS